MKINNPILLGNGISGHSFLLYLSQAFKDFKQINVIDSQGLFKSVDANINIIVSENGIKKGKSDLGDLLYDSYEFFLKNFDDFDGVEKAPQYFLKKHPKVSLNKFIRRFGSEESKISQAIFTQEIIGVERYSRIIDAVAFLKAIKQQSKLQINNYHHDIVKISYPSCPDDGPIKLISNGGKVLETNFLIISAGPFTKFLPYNFQESTILERHKVNIGGVWSASANLGDENFIFTIEMANFTYLAKQKIVQISGVSDDQGICLNLRDRLFSYYQIFSLLLKNIPKFDHGVIYSSYRDKGRARMPYFSMKKVGDNLIFYLCGVYKNGYTLSPFLANKLINEYITSCN